MNFSVFEVIAEDNFFEIYFLITSLSNFSFISGAIGFSQTNIPFSKLLFTKKSYITSSLLVLDVPNLFSEIKIFGA